MPPLPTTFATGREPMSDQQESQKQEEFPPLRTITSGESAALHKDEQT